MDLAAALKGFYAGGNHKFGTVYAASGCTRRTPSNGRLDWALVKPLDDTRIGRNTYTRPLENSGRKCRFHTPCCTDFWRTLQQPCPNNKPSHDQRLFVRGAFSGETIGQLSLAKANLTLGDGQPHSEELVFLRSHTSSCYGRLLVGEGDAGAVVSDQNRRAMGMLLGQKLSPLIPFHAYGFMTPIEDVFNDIKLLSGGLVTDVRIAMD